ncbi:glycosyltransferase involved in cell wall biosynthesis [Duganella sp. 1224]|uniref:glycosyltransferase n=1 Tax=Duganella sp. 1224 TaxID=2587052 RepID=UPI0015C9BC6F|nr:glycosyltransferase [Duganella sp. 1224]NYE62158.1 glycosyltransferase involved in cell wall biosynthesis [Duganella sp. 1224]
MILAYITSIYGRASDTFIRNEVIALRQRGHTVHTYSIRRAEEDQHVSAEVRSEQAGTDYILERPRAQLLANLAGAVLRQPAAFWRTLRLAWQTRPAGVAAAARQLVYLVEACYLARRLRAQGVQLLHNHIAENSATVAMLASSLSGIPFSMTVHGPGIFYDPRKWALATKIARASFTVCITSFCKSQCMVFADPADFAKLHVVHCSVGPEFTDVAPLPVPAAPKLVCVGRLCPEKGMLLLVEAVARHVAAGGQCELTFIGDGPSRRPIEQLIARHGLQQSVRLLGWQGSAVVRSEIEASRALVLPSFAEGLPIVIMEALALGRPVVSTRIAGIPELVEDGRSGWLVAAGSHDELVTALQAVTSADPQTLAAMGASGAAAVRARHHVATETAKLEQLMLQAV